MILNVVIDVALRYFTDIGKPALQHITASICGGIYVRFCSVCTMLSVRKFTFAISSPDEFLVYFVAPPTMSSLKKFTFAVSYRDELVLVIL